MGGDIALADADGLGKFAQARLHRDALAGERLLALALGGDAEACFGQGVGGLGLGLAEQGDSGPCGGPFLAGRGESRIGVFQFLLESRDAAFQLAEMGLQGGDFPVENLVAVTDILEFARGQQMVGLGGGEESLGVAEMLAGLAEAVDGSLQ